MAHHKHTAQPPIVEQESTGMWSRFKKFAESGFGKGLLITAAATIIVLAVVAGTMGAGAIGGLKVGGVLVPNLESGISAGVSKAIEFLVHPAGLMTMLGGGIAGSYIEAKRNQNLIAKDNERIAKEMEALRNDEPQQELQKAVQPEAEKAPNLANEQTQEMHRRQDDPQNVLHDKDGQVVQNDKSAAPADKQSEELKALEKRTAELEKELQAMKGTGNPATEPATKADTDKLSEELNRKGNSELLVVEKRNAELEKELQSLKAEKSDPVKRDVERQSEIIVANVNNNTTNNTTQKSPDAADKGGDIVNVQIANHEHNNFEMKQLSSTTNLNLQGGQALASAMDESIYVKGSAIKDKTFSAIELKRRADRDLSTSKTV